MCNKRAITQKGSFLSYPPYIANDMVKDRRVNVINKTSTKVTLVQLIYLIKEMLARLGCFSVCDVNMGRSQKLCTTFVTWK